MGRIRIYPLISAFFMIVEDEGLTVVMATHDPSMIDIADHVLTMEDGEIIDAGRRAEGWYCIGDIRTGRMPEDDRM